MVVILTGFTAAGKDTYQQAIIKKHKNKISKLITYTTRPIRPKEKNGVHYHFITDDEFTSLAAANELIGIREFESQSGIYRYGIKKTDFNEESIQTIILDPSGTLELLSEIDNNKLFIVYLEASEQELHLRAALRGDDRTSFLHRLASDKKEFLPLYSKVNLMLNTNSEDGIEENIKAIEYCLEEKL